MGCSGPTTNRVASETSLEAFALQKDLWSDMLHESRQGIVPGLQDCSRQAWSSVSLGTGLQKKVKVSTAFCSQQTPNGRSCTWPWPSCRRYSSAGFHRMVRICSAAVWQMMCQLMTGLIIVQPLVQSKTGTRPQACNHTRKVSCRRIVQAASGCAG